MEFNDKIMLHGFREVKCRWESGKGRRVMRWQGGKDWRVVRWEGGSFLVLFKDREHRVSLFVSDVN